MQAHTGSLYPRSLVAYNAGLVYLAFMPQTFILAFESLECTVKPVSWWIRYIPEWMYPHTKISYSEYCTPVHDSLVNRVQGHNIRSLVPRHRPAFRRFLGTRLQYWWVLQQCEKKAMTALDGCFSTSGLSAEWYKKTCAIAIRHLCTTREMKMRRQKRARMRSSELSIV